MSLKSWKAEFYPKPASRAKGSDLAALDHCIRKWEGAKAAALKRHDVYRDGATWGGFQLLMDDVGGHMEFRSDTCALCHRYIIPKETCADCPLFEVTDVECGQGVLQEKADPYGTFFRGGSPMPMIRALKKARKLVEER